MAKSTNRIWQILQVRHEGTNKVKESKISVLVHRFELFKMKENVTIAEMVIRFTNITNSFASLRKEYTQVEKVRNILRALTSYWEKKITAIEETNDLSTMSLENLIGNLMALKYNLKIERRMNNNFNPRRKYLPSIHPQILTIQMTIKRRWQCSQENQKILEAR